MSKNTLISIVVIIIVIVLGYFLLNNNKSTNDPVQMLDTQTQMDTTTAIDENLDAIDVDSSTGSDLESIDSELDNL